MKKIITFIIIFFISIFFISNISSQESPQAIIKLITATTAKDSSNTVTINLIAGKKYINEIPLRNVAPTGLTETLANKCLNENWRTYRPRWKYTTSHWSIGHIRTTLPHNGLDIEPRPHPGNSTWEKFYLTGTPINNGTWNVSYYAMCSTDSGRSIQRLTLKINVTGGTNYRALKWHYNPFHHLHDQDPEIPLLKARIVSLEASNLSLQTKTASLETKFTTLDSMARTLSKKQCDANSSAYWDAEQTALERYQYRGVDFYRMHCCLPPEPQRDAAAAWSICTTAPSTSEDNE